MTIEERLERLEKWQKEMIPLIVELKELLHDINNQLHSSFRPPKEKDLAT